MLAVNAITAINESSFFDREFAKETLQKAYEALEELKKPPITYHMQWKTTANDEVFTYNAPVPTISLKEIKESAGTKKIIKKDEPDFSNFKSSKQNMKFYDWLKEWDRLAEIECVAAGDVVTKSSDWPIEDLMYDYLRGWSPLMSWNEST